jgi:sodium-dependent dicarboxylate transporter 2/3/5
MFIVGSLSLNDDRGKTLGLLGWMIVWWVSETVSAYVTALLPLIVLPLAGIMSMDAAAQPYGSKIIFLFLGGFILAAALEKHQVHRQIALRVLAFAGGGNRSVLAALMFTTAFLSMWMSNTATVLMMMPIALAALGQLGQRGQTLRRPVLLGIAYAGSLGGLATLVGSPPNIVMAGFIENRYGLSVSFTQWLIVGLPVSLFLLILFFWLITFVIFRKSFASEGRKSTSLYGIKALIQPWTPSQRRVLAIMSLVILLWLIREYLPIKSLTDHAIALAGGILMFIIPNPGKKGENLLVWEDSKNLPWGILLLFGGGLSLAQGLEKSGVIAWLGESVARSDIRSPWIFMAVFTALALIMTEFMSNVALVNVLVPVLLGIADNMDLPPLYLALPVTLAATCAFMFPIATPPNAVVYSTGFVPIRDMIRMGLWMNLAAWLVIVLYAELLHRLHGVSVLF